MTDASKPSDEAVTNLLTKIESGEVKLREAIEIAYSHGIMRGRVERAFTSGNHEPEVQT